MTPSRRVRARTLAVPVAAASLLLAACGGADGTTPSPPAADPGPRPELPVTSSGSPLPAVTVRDVTNDEWVQFADLAPADRPILLWFWAPH